MKGYYAYIRVSTNKQGKTVSMPEQKFAIERFAASRGIEVSQWFEEQETAAKQGRSKFVEMLRQLRAGEAQGLLVHKLDRSSRNLSDWAALGQLIDSGLEVHFVHETLDLRSRGGRLSADIQAVVSADFIRNLRSETIKGLVGRLRQGLYPFHAPLGYLNHGGGKVKTVDPVRGPLVREAFELYASGRYTLETLEREMFARGLRGRRGKRVGRMVLSRLLRNPFAAGLTSLASTGETFEGVHERLISMRTFKAVQETLDGKKRTTKWIHNHLFRGLFECNQCRRSLVGERQKGVVYYRCHGCSGCCVREDALERAVLRVLSTFAMPVRLTEALQKELQALQEVDSKRESQRIAGLRMKFEETRTREMRLVDALVDGHLDAVTFATRKQLLLEERQLLQEALSAASGSTEGWLAFLQTELELAFSAQQSYVRAEQPEKRDLIKHFTSNRRLAAKDVSVEPEIPFALVGNSDLVTECCHSRYRVRTLKDLAEKLAEWAKNEILKKPPNELDNSNQQAA